jgi:hypothetical protein
LLIDDFEANNRLSGDEIYPPIILSACRLVATEWQADGQSKAR